MKIALEFYKEHLSREDVDARTLITDCMKGFAKANLESLLLSDEQIEREADAKIEAPFTSPKWGMYRRGYIESAKHYRSLIQKQLNEIK